MPIRKKNTWGSTLEPQRSDLWTVDLLDMRTQDVGVNNNTVGGNDFLRVIQYYYAGHPALIPLKDLKTTSHFVQKISFPESKIGVETHYKDNIPYAAPAYDEVNQAAKMEFLVESPDKPSQGESYVPSTIITLLTLWKNLARAGRRGDGISPESDDPIPLLDSENFKVPYRFDLVCTMLSGFLDTSRGEIVLGAGIENSHAYNLVTSSRVLLRGSWCSSVQISEASYAKGNELQTVSASVQCEKVIPLKINS